MRIAVIGTGLIGQAWAIVFARGKHEVRLWDGFAEATAKAMPLIAEQLADLYTAGLIDEPAAALLARIKGFDRLEDALDGADYVQESLPESSISRKRSLLAWINSSRQRPFWQVRPQASRRQLSRKICPAVHVASSPIRLIHRVLCPSLKSVALPGLIRRQCKKPGM